MVAVTDALREGQSLLEIVQRPRVVAEHGVGFAQSPERLAFSLLVSHFTVDVERPDVTLDGTARVSPGHKDDGDTAERRTFQPKVFHFAGYDENLLKRIERAVE